MATQLPHLPEVERLSPACVRILGGNPGKFTLQGTNTYLVGTGRGRILVDTGEGRSSWITALTRALREEDATVTDVILTHWHPDHVGGVKDVLAHVNADARVHKKHRPSHDDDQELDIQDGDVFRADGASLTAVHSPGHTTDHIALVLQEEDAMFTGDNVLGHGTSVYEDLGDYMRSLGKMQPLFRGRAYPGHGPVIDNGPAKIQEYIFHRQQREDQVLQTLQSTTKDASDPGADNSRGLTSGELVKIIYSDVREELHPAAEKGVRQILGKLQQEQKVLPYGDKWLCEVGGKLLAKADIDKP
ncbi:lactamase [Pyricularia oryzae 70-15]|uniref:Lactamase n=2 Tax=Pyricularia oryzae TaxID=318829 RepID=G4N7R7_PYRO7|nr:lactamase [Pyricularia oryzae 70-15]EHA50072.1 lactamase [Pyricularia oryzae 70-15]KAI7927340.1 lactamase [Pyricularia oryzae]KAI7927865.1 lactamase [Pyricularia oryzae]QBZ60606.1 hypothetical protein PoMZ_07548 [Pyricularia oryzae]